MSFARSAGRVIASTISKSVLRGLFGAIAGVAGANIFPQKIPDTAIIGVMTGGINGAIDGFCDQVAKEAGEPVRTLGEDNKLQIVIKPDQSVARVQYALYLADFATPLLAKYILDQAKQNDVSVDMAFATYYAGGAVVIAWAVILGCFTCGLTVNMVADALLPNTYAQPVKAHAATSSLNLFKNKSLKNDGSKDSVRKENESKAETNDHVPENNEHLIDVDVAPPRLVRS